MKNNQKVLCLVRKERIWICPECKKQYRKEVPVQCSCGALDKVFLEKDLPIEETSRSNYIVLDNFIYNAQTIIKGNLVSLSDNDKCTKNLIERNLIKRLEETHKKRDIIKNTISTKNVTRRKNKKRLIKNDFANSITENLQTITQP